MEVETKFLRLREPIEWGHNIDGWRVCWLGGWDKDRVFYVVASLQRSGWAIVRWAKL
jgi:hypothetical protein